MSYTGFVPNQGYPYAALQPQYAAPQALVRPNYGYAQPQQPAYGYAPQQPASPYNAAFNTAAGYNRPTAASLSPYMPLSAVSANNQLNNNNGTQSNVYNNFQSSMGANPYVGSYPQTTTVANPWATAYSQPVQNPLAALYAQPSAYSQNPLAALYSQPSAYSQNPLASLYSQPSVAPQNPLAALFGQNASYNTSPINGTNILPIIIREQAQAPAQPVDETANMMNSLLQALLLSQLLNDDGPSASAASQPFSEPVLNWNDVSNWLNSNSSNGTVWGDPHFKDLTNASTNPHTVDYDVMGKAGQTYSMISDKNIQFNSKFKAWGRDDVTVNGTAAFKLKADDGQEHRVLFDADSNTPTFDGVAIKDGETKSIKVNGKEASVTFKAGVLTVLTHEYKVEAQDKGTYLDYTVQVQKDGVFSDKVNPHGLLGQTADGDSNIRAGAKGAGAQGQGAIDLKVTDYEVKDLFDDPKAFVNRYGVNSRAVADDKGNVKAVYDDKNNLIAARDKDDKLVSVRRVDDGKGGTVQTLADGKTKVDDSGKIVADKPAAA